MATFLLGKALSPHVAFSGLQLVTDLSLLPLETSWRTADGLIITAFGQDLGLDPTGTYTGTAQDIRIADASGAVLLVVRGIDRPLFSLTSGLDTATLTGGDDDFFGTAEADVIPGGAGDDLFRGGGGDDRILGEAGIDTLDGGDGDDEILGGEGGDKIYGGNGDDLIRGEADDDLIYGNAGVDTLDGGDGCDLIFGGQDGDKIYGGQGNDDLYGENGDDFIFGNAGVDYITGGRGRDTLTGGEDRDYFNYDSRSETGKTAATRDVILDFTKGEDQIDLSTIDASTAKAGNQAFAFRGTGSFTGVAGQVRFTVVDAAGTDNDKIIISADVNGDRQADFQIELTGLLHLTKGDFIL